LSTFKFPIARPSISSRERKLVLDCLDTGWISSQGKYIKQFEDEFGLSCGAKHAIATNNGTTALHLALAALGVKPGDEVIVPSLTYIATANAVRYCGATVVFVDSNREDLTIEVEKIEAAITERTVGIIPVHLYGMVADMSRIMGLARDYKLWVLEDAAEAQGAKHKMQSVGSLGDVGIFSFFGNKIITTGEGGMVTTDRDDLAEKMRILRNQGMSTSRRYWFEEIGFNYRMTNIQAAIGLAQLERAKKTLEERNAISQIYRNALSPIMSSIRFLSPRDSSTPVVWLETLMFPRANEQSRDALMVELGRRGIETRPIFYPLTSMPLYKTSSSFPVAEWSSERGINLPTYVGLKPKEIRAICAEVIDVSQSLGISRRETGKVS
jgi:perosamine synthetase